MRKGRMQEARPDVYSDYGIYSERVHRYAAVIRK